MSWARDLRTSCRQLLHAPLFTLVAVLTLALGIGANTAIFTLVDGVLLRTLPVASPHQLYRVGDQNDCCVNGGFPGDNGDYDVFSYAIYHQLQAASAPAFTSMAAVEAGFRQWAVRRGAHFSASLYGELVSGNYFRTLGVKAFAGRLLDAGDGQPSSAPVAVLSYGAWQQEFGGDRSILGATISIMNHPFTVVGVAPPGFFGDRVSATPPALWLTLQQQPVIWAQTNPASFLLNLPSENWLYLIGRVRAGTSIPAVQAKLSAALRHWLKTQPEFTSNGGNTVIPRQHVVVVSAAGGVQSLQQDSGAGLLLCMALVGVLLLIACANVANMLLARGAARRTEVALRMALGESRGALMRRMLTESVLLAVAGGVLGLALAYGGARLILGLMFTQSSNSAISAVPSWPVLGFAFGVSLLVGVLFGLAPAWAASHAQPAEALRGANRSTRDRSTFSQHALVIFQVALSLVLLVSAFITATSLANVQDQNFGISTTGRYVLHVNPAGAGYTPETAPALDRRLESAFAVLPGVSHIGMALYSPLEGDNWGECVIQEGHPAPGPNTNCGSTWDRVNAGFLDSIGVPVIEGRGFTAADTSAAPMVAMVNQTFVKRFFPHQDPIGQHFGIDFTQYSGSFEIVGVFRDFTINNPRQPRRPVYLRPMTQYYSGYTQPVMKSGENGSMFLDAIVVDFAHVPANAPALLRRTLANIDPNLIVAQLETFQAQVAHNFAQDRLLSSLAALFAVLALILACIGLYGVTAFLVARRSGEIGVRMALGASRGRIAGMVLSDVGLKTAIGLAIGLPAAVVAARLMQSQMFGIGPYDPRALVGGVVVLGICALAAGLIPARRASATDPARTLRAD
ncbi:MAG: ABC transporter permease [Terriglobales bacterium]